MVTPIGLIVHELATNAVKYGGLSLPGGAVTIAWRIVRDADGAARTMCILPGPKPAARPSRWPMRATIPASGTRMTRLAANQVGGTLERQWPTCGAIAHCASRCRERRDRGFAKVKACGRCTHLPYSVAPGLTRGPAAFFRARARTQEAGPRIRVPGRRR